MIDPGVRSVTEAEHLSRRLDQVHDSLTKVRRVKDDRSLDACSLEGHEERIKSIDADLQIIKRDMLLLGDYESWQKRQLPWKKLRLKFSWPSSAG